MSGDALMPPAPPEAFDRAKSTLSHLHRLLVDALGRAGGQTLSEERWNNALGDGTSAITEGGQLWERAFVGFSQVGGAKLPDAASSRHPHLAGSPWQACGLSLVTHPMSPFVPATHLNLRFFQVQPPKAAKKQAMTNWWVGGGFDLSPCYPEEADCQLWHAAARAGLEPFQAGLYEQFKAACDEYFQLPHRGEMRGIGGVFFDDFNRLPFAECLQMQRALCWQFLLAELRLTRKYRHRPYTQAQKDFQLYRRGRYAEFNLLLDRGTRFGLSSGGRSESILASMPPQVRWQYRYEPPEGSSEAALNDFLQPRDWCIGADSSGAGMGAEAEKEASMICRARSLYDDDKTSEALTALQQAHLLPLPSPAPAQTRDLHR